MAVYVIYYKMCFVLSIKTFYLIYYIISLVVFCLLKWMIHKFVMVSVGKKEKARLIFIGNKYNLLLFIVVISHIIID